LIAHPAVLIFNVASVRHWEVGSAAVRVKRSFKSHFLFVRIAAIVLNSEKRLTVAEIADILELQAVTVAHCIGLQLYFEGNQIGELTIPPPIDYRAPHATDVIDRELFNPKRVESMVAVEAAVAKALAEVIEARSTVSLTAAS
jgi:hypothetical protein